MQTSIDSSSLFVWRMIVFFLQEPRFKKLILGQTLQCYKEVSGQRINFDKSALSYSRNVPRSQ